VSKIPSPTSNFTPPPAGTFPAICYRIVDLGTQDSTWKGKPRKAHKVLISWEIKDDEAVMEDGRPMSIHQRYTWSMNEKAALRKDLESWRGKAFTEADFDVFDMKNLLGVGCFMGLVHKIVDGTTYTNISAISKLPKGMEVAPLVNKPQIIWLDGTFDQAAFEELSEGLQNTIKLSPEYQQLTTGKSERIIPERGGDDLDDPIPF
jgi:hypothetical protein